MAILNFTVAIQSPRRSGPFSSSAILLLTLITTLFSALLLTGCQSDREKRIADAESNLRNVNLSSKTSSVNGMPQLPELNSVSNAPSEIVVDKALGMPIYPRSKPFTAGATTLTNTGDGIAMTLLETKDSVDSVISFYKGRLGTEKSEPSVSAPSINDEVRDGKRVVRLTKPLSSGGLQTVEARQFENKTIIELMNIQSVNFGKPSTFSGLSNSTNQNNPSSMKQK